MLRVPAIAAAWLVFVSLAPSRALAQREDTATLREARTLFERGLELSDQERWGEALGFFRRSRALAPRPSTIYNVALVLQRLGRLGEAATSYEEFLTVAPVNDERRGEAQHQLEMVRASMAELRLRVTPPDAIVTVDGAAAAGTGASRSLSLDPGEHRVVVAASGRQSQTLTLSVSPGAAEERAISLRPAEIGAGLTESSAAAGVRDEGEESGGVLSSPAFWIVAAVVVAGAAIGLGAVLLSEDGDDDYAGSSGVVLVPLGAP